MAERAETLSKYMAAVARLARVQILTGPDGLYFALAEVAADLCAAKHASILIPVDAAQREVVGCSGQPSMPLQKEPLLDGVVGLAFKNRGHKRIADVSKCRDYRQYDPQVQSELAIPISDRARSRIEMVINLESEALGHFSEDDVPILGNLGELALEMRTRIQVKLQSSSREAFLAKILEQSPDEVLVIDKWFRPLYGNEIKREKFPELDAYLRSHPVDPSSLPVGPPPATETCYSLIEGRDNRCELCVANRSMETGVPELSCYEAKSKRTPAAGYTVELSAKPLTRDKAVLGCIETARQITQREIVLDHSPELMKGVTEDQALRHFVVFLHDTMKYKRVRLYSLHQADGLLRGKLYQGEHPRLSQEQFERQNIRVPEVLLKYVLGSGKPGVIILSDKACAEESRGYWRALVPRTEFCQAVDPRDLLELSGVSEILVVPLKVGTANWAIFLDCGSTGNFTHDDLQALSIFCRVAGAAIQATHEHRTKFIMACLGEANSGLLHAFSGIVMGLRCEKSVLAPFISMVRELRELLQTYEEGESRCLYPIYSRILRSLEQDEPLPTIKESEVLVWMDKLMSKTRGRIGLSLASDIAPIASLSDASLDEWTSLLTAKTTPQWTSLIKLMVSIARGLAALTRASQECFDLSESIRKVLPRLEQMAQPPEEADLVQIIDLAIQTLRQRSELRDGVRVERIPMPDRLQVRLRKYQVFMTVLFLLDNALRAAAVGGSKGRVTVQVDAEGADVKIVLSNNGERVPPEHVSKIRREPFTTREQKGGTGLGLMLAWAWVDEENGILDHTYDEVNRLTIFTIRGPWALPESRKEGGQ